MEDLKPAISKNIIELRKTMNWTQAELAQKLNYSDKAVSKWERAESIPDVAVLKEIADLFHVRLDYLLEVEHDERDDSLLIISGHTKRNRLIVTLLSASLVFLIATILFVVLELFKAPMAVPTWMVYVYAVPVLCIVLLVFNSIWGRGKVNYVIITALVWSILLAVYLTFLSWHIWLIFVIGIPGQIIILLWSRFKFIRK
ncbi:hypothetical protein SDC9_78943 [bioreactor metagenome]|uniref:HTH cro/C1-type domain-containing protein n=1 Tax=bioreactor metagenome TaxID=1076179 RepID=A0A644YX03_9ZZZZ